MEEKEIILSQIVSGWLNVIGLMESYCIISMTFNSGAKSKWNNNSFQKDSPLRVAQRQSKKFLNSFLSLGSNKI